MTAGPLPPYPATVYSTWVPEPHWHFARESDIPGKFLENYLEEAVTELGALLFPSLVLPLFQWEGSDEIGPLRITPSEFASLGLERTPHATSAFTFIRDIVVDPNVLESYSRTEAPLAYLAGSIPNFERNWIAWKYAANFERVVQAARAATRRDRTLTLGIYRWKRIFLANPYIHSSDFEGFEEYAAYCPDKFKFAYLSQYQDAETHRQEYRIAQYLFPLVRQRLKEAIVKYFIRAEYSTYHFWELTCSGFRSYSNLHQVLIIFQQLWRLKLSEYYEDDLDLIRLHFVYFHHRSYLPFFFGFAACYSWAYPRR